MTNATQQINEFTAEALSVFTNVEFKKVAIDIAKSMGIEITEENGTLILFSGYLALKRTEEETGLDILSKYRN